MSNHYPQSRQDVRSDEEWHMVLWLREAIDRGIITRWAYESEVFPLVDAKSYTITEQLKTKTRQRTRSMHQAAVYTPDFMMEFTEYGLRLLKPILPKAFAHGETVLRIDVKGSYDPHQGDGRYLSLVRKIMWQRHQIWIEKIIPSYSKGKKEHKTYKGFFVQTWCPEALRWMRNRRHPTLTAKGRACLSIDDFVALGQCANAEQSTLF